MRLGRLLATSRLVSAYKIGDNLLLVNFQCHQCLKLGIQAYSIF